MFFTRKNESQTLFLILVFFEKHKFSNITCISIGFNETKTQLYRNTILAIPLCSFYLFSFYKVFFGLLIVTKLG